MAHGKEESFRAPESERDRPTEAYVRLCDLIVSGQMAPGNTIIESRVADSIGMNRMAVRSALRRLRREGYLASRPLNRYSRSIVSPLTVNDMEELFSIMGALDRIAVRRVASEELSERAALCVELRQINHGLLGCVGDLSRVVDAQDLHVAFHRCYADRGAGPRLRTEIDALRPQAERYERAYTSALCNELAESVREHDVLIGAIERGSETEAADAVEQNWLNGALRYRRAMALMGERGTAALGA